MAELTINWETMTRVSPEVVKEKVITSETSSADPEAPAAAMTPQTSDKPFMIYVNAVGATTDGFDTLEKVVLDDDRVKLASHAFHAVKMAPEDVAKDELLAEKGGKAVPRIIFVSPDFKAVKALEGGSLKLGEVWGAMKATSDKFYVQDLDGIVKEMKSILNEFDKVNAERKVLDGKEARLKDKPNAKDQKEIETKRAELDARDKKAQERKDALWKLKVKDAKATAA
jgi:hypothetical protein